MRTIPRDAKLAIKWGLARWVGAEVAAEEGLVSPDTFLEGAKGHMNFFVNYVLNSALYQGNQDWRCIFFLFLFLVVLVK